MARKSLFLIKRKDKVSQTDDAVFESEGITIGRLISNDLVLNQRAVSRVHAGIKELQGEYWIFNLSSSNGTLLDGQLVSRSPISDGDVIQIGPYLLQIGLVEKVLSITVEMGLEVRPLESRPLQQPGSPGSVDGTLLMQMPRSSLKATAGSAKLAGTGLLSALLPALDEQALNAFWDKRKREAGKIEAKTRLHPRGNQMAGKVQYNWRPTLDLKRLWRKSYFAWATAVVAVLSLAAVYLYSDAYSPGPLTVAHASVDPPSRPIAARANGGSCSNCHSISWRTRMQDSCSACHSTAGFTPLIYTAHQREGMQCTSCHTEHQGRDTRNGLIAYGTCSSCHNQTYRIKTGEKAGEVLGIPHGGSVGYPVENGEWKKWKGLSADDWRRKGFTEDLTRRTPSQQFHAVHQEGRMADRIRCKDCHTAGARGDALWRRTPQAECVKCHGLVSASRGVIRVQANCNSCHQQHGASRDLASLVPGAGTAEKKIKDYFAKLDTKGPQDDEPALATGRVFQGFGGAGRVRHDKESFTSGAVSEVGAVPWYAWLTLVGVLPLAALLVVMTGSVRRRHSLASAAARPALKEEVAPIATGSLDLEKLRAEAPPYPHPVIDPVLCIGCHACVEACPHDVLAIVNGIASPVAIDQCMEDTSCQVECPTNPKACIVINTTKVIPPRKVPARNQRFMTNVDGIYLIGDVSGVPLIKNAINEGAQVVDCVVEDVRRASPGSKAEYDLAIIGIGPAGLSATAIAKQRGLKYIAIEQDKVVSTIDNYPAGKYIFFKPETVEAKGLIPLPGVGEMKETILQSWMNTITQHGLKINQEECCTGIKPEDGDFKVTAEKGKAKEKVAYTARRVIIAVGNRGTPMKLKVKGEELKIMVLPGKNAQASCPSCRKPRRGGQAFCVWCGAKIEEVKPVPYLDDKVKYKLSDPEDYVGKKCIVVGAGNSAIEAAVDLCGFKRDGDRISFIRDGEVALVIRSDFKGDLKLGNKMNVYDCIDAGRIKVFFRTEIQEITEAEVVLMDVRTKEEKARIRNDYVFALIGGERPTKFLESLGIKIG